MMRWAQEVWLDSSKVITAETPKSSFFNKTVILAESASRQKTVYQKVSKLYPDQKLAKSKIAEF